MKKYLSVKFISVFFISTLLYAFLFSCSTPILYTNDVDQKIEKGTTQETFQSFELEPLFTSGFQGFTYERLPDGSIGPKIAGVTIKFEKNDGTYLSQVTSSIDGFYKIGLPPGKYKVTASRNDYFPYSTGTGYFVVIEDTYNTGNIFLKKINCGYQGHCFERLPDGSIGPKLEGVLIKFVKNDGTYSVQAISSSTGFYKINLLPGAYKVTASLDGYFTYYTEVGYFIVTEDTYNTGNIFLKKENSGYRGFTYEKKLDGSIGPKIGGVSIKFIKNDGSYSKEITSDSTGFYKISLLPGKYKVTASKTGYYTYSTGDGFFVVIEDEYLTGNFFLSKKFILPDLTF